MIEKPLPNNFHLNNYIYAMVQGPSSSDLEEPTPEAAVQALSRKDTTQLQAG